MNETARVIVPETLPKREASRLPVAMNPDANPMQMLAIAVQQGADLAKLEKLMDLEQRWQREQARKAFVTALANFKKNPPKVIKDMVNTQYKSKYASLGNLVNTVNIALGEHGLNARWTLQQTENRIKVGCVLTHELGHSEQAELESTPDSSGSKNPLQQIKSTITYLEGATFQAITGVVATNEDDDGNGSGKKPPEAAPAGYDNWSADMEALAEEGSSKLQDAWKNSKDEFRRYAVKFDEQWWNDTKRKASKAKGVA